ncbi:MAG: hypothetical protein PHC28_04925 [Flavobacterium sp.]|uniref:hypothetical protein n=1 Tax=Flavobacterium sp. TaxID=239 RepID=UPI002629BD32|nr:hypothetical protein [Flavobacterium sp.]MDD5149809.1 hypothetical protein [Flavobacterium sp.]
MDLEETIITSWSDFLFSQTNAMNIKEVKSWLLAREIKEVNIFSAAIWNKGDKEIFADQMKNDLEELLGVIIIKWPSIEDLMKETKKFDRYHYENTTEYIQQNGKFISFLKYCMINGKDQHNILIDDCVTDWTMIDSTGKTIIETINILTITGKNGNFTLSL